MRKTNSQMCYSTCTVPLSISNMFVNTFAHEYSTRGHSGHLLYRDNLRRPNTRSKIYSFQNIALWNNLPQDIRTCSESKRFINLSKKFLLT